MLIQGTVASHQGERAQRIRDSVEPNLTRSGAYGGAAAIGSWHGAGRRARRAAVRLAPARPGRSLGRRPGGRGGSGSLLGTIRQPSLGALPADCFELFVRVDFWIVCLVPCLSLILAVDVWNTFGRRASQEPRSGARSIAPAARASQSEELRACRGNARRVTRVELPNWR